MKKNLTKKKIILFLFKFKKEYILYFSFKYSSKKIYIK